MNTLQLAEQILSEERDFLDSLENHLNDFFEYQETILRGISAESLALLESIRSLSIGGKRLRALLAYWGWRSAGGTADAQEIIQIGAAIELFQSAALIHDDIIDRSDTRRGAPSVHRKFEKLHAENSWRTEGESFGESSAIITGDLCLCWSEQMLNRASSASSLNSRGRAIFDLMRTEVMAGQYLDILGEVVNTENDEQAETRSRRVLRYKSAKYSCEHPLVLGAACALGATTHQEYPLLNQLSEFGLPLGEAFQMRDDELGVFGKAEVTGKPAGDDLREGKRTLLIALTQQKATDEQWNILDGSLGLQELTTPDIEKLQSIITECGALEALEQEIEETGRRASERLDAMPIDPLYRAALDRIVSRLLHRAS